MQKAAGDAAAVAIKASSSGLDFEVGTPGDVLCRFQFACYLELISTEKKKHNKKQT